MSYRSFRSTLMVFTLLAAAPAGRAAADLVARVPDDLRTTESYTLYGRMLVQIDLLANPRTASLPVNIAAIRPGTLVIEGRVPSPRIKEYIVTSAQRITGLSIESHLEVGDVGEDPLFSPPAAELEADAQATVRGFYPEVASSVRVTVRDNGFIELNGDVPNYETKLNLSRIVKSQPGCRAVVNLLRVPANPDSGAITVSEDGSLALEAQRLPLIPAAPLVDLSPERDDHPSISLRQAQADDAPAGGSTNIRVVEEARLLIDGDPQLALMDLEVDTDGGGLVVSGKLDSRSRVEAAIDRLSSVSDITKVIVKSRPYSMQRTFPNGKKDSPSAAPTDWKTRMMRWMPGSASDDPVAMAGSWRFRESVRRSLIQLCERRLDDLSVKSTTRGLVIEGTIANARDRAFVLKQVDNLASLRNVPCDIVLEIKAD